MFDGTEDVPEAKPDTKGDEYLCHRSGASPALCSRLCYSIRGFAGVASGKPTLLSPASAGLFRGLGRNADTATNRAARRYIVLAEAKFAELVHPPPPLRSEYGARPASSRSVGCLHTERVSAKVRRSTAALVGLFALLGGIAAAMTKEPEVGIGLVAVGALLLMRIVV